MNLKDIIKLRGINGWHLANTLGWNLLGTSLVLMSTRYFLEKKPTTTVFLQLFLFIGIFLVSLTGGLLFGRLAADNRGLTYGVLGSFASAALSLFLVVPSGGILGAMLAIISVAGGFNGGLLSYKKAKRKV